MTSKAALCMALLQGRVINIKNGFELFGITNVPREIGRSVERSFDVEVSRNNRKAKSRYGQRCTWVDYRLNHTRYNMPGIHKMKAYVKEQFEKSPPPKTDSSVKKYQQIELFIKSFS